MSDQRQLPENFNWRAITPEDSPKTPMDVLSDPIHQSLSTAKVTQDGPAYGFSSPIYDFSQGRRVDTGRHFNLLEVARKKPVALIFGSYT